MRTMILLIFSTFLFADYALAGGVEVKFSADLSIQKQCKPSDIFCSIMVITSRGGIKLNLVPQYIEDIGCLPDCGNREVSYWRGVWSQVVENDSVRGIAIVSVNKYRIVLSDEETFYYTLMAEIIDSEGVSAKMSVDVSDMNQISNSTLHGRAITSNGETYNLELYIGKYYGANECPISGCEENKDKSDWNVERGYLK